MPRAIYSINFVLSSDEEYTVDCTVSGKEVYCESDNLFNRLFPSLNDNGQLQITLNQVIDGTTPVEEIQVEVRSGILLLGSETFRPLFTKFYPNGEDCPPACLQAEGTMIITQPNP